MNLAAWIALITEIATITQLPQVQRFIADLVALIAHHAGPNPPTMPLVLPPVSVVAPPAPPK